MTFNDQQLYYVKPFFSDSDLNSTMPYLAKVPSPELIGALMSITSRTGDDLRWVFWEKFLQPMLAPTRESDDTEQSFADKVKQAKSLEDWVRFLHKNPIAQSFNSKRARNFYIKWLAQYGDNSIAQMTGFHLVIPKVSQVALRFIEDMRIIAVIEQSTRFVDYSSRDHNGRFLYHIPSDLSDSDRLDYCSMMDKLFETYKDMLAKANDKLQQLFPEEKAQVLGKAALDNCRGLLPTSTLSQVAIYGNAQVLEHLINRCVDQPISEISDLGQAIQSVLYQEAPSLFSRFEQPQVKHYQSYLGGKHNCLAKPFAEKMFTYLKRKHRHTDNHSVKLIGTSGSPESIITGLLFELPHDQLPYVANAPMFADEHYWEQLSSYVNSMTEEDKDTLLEICLADRTEKWMKLPRAFEQLSLTLEITTNIGAARDILRHRIGTIQHQGYSPLLGHDTPQLIIDCGLTEQYCSILDQVFELYQRLVKTSPTAVRYVACLAHRMRIVKVQNLRQLAYEIELRTGSQGHPDYRLVYQQIWELINSLVPRLAKYIKVDLNQYQLARRGMAEQAEKKEQRLKAAL